MKLILVGRNMLGQDFTNRITNNNILVLEPQPRINIVALMERAEIMARHLAKKQFGKKEGWIYEIPNTLRYRMDQL